MEEYIARENIRRFEAQLLSCADERQKEVLKGLLDQERAHLQRIRQSQATGRPDS